MNENVFVSCGDFKIKYELRNADNSLAPIGSKPFSLKYFNPEDPSIFVIASFDGNNYVNIVPKVDYYSICLPSPQFNCGRLFCEEIISEIDTDFLSGLRKIASTYDVGEIVRYVDNNSVLNVQTNFATGVWIDLNWRFVSVLPSLGELKTLYFVPNGSNSDFYIYADESWNKVGTTSIDMSNYFTKADISSLLDGFTSTISSIITRVEYVEKISVKTIIPLIGEQDGVNKHFTTEKDFIIGASQLYVNGIRLFIGLDYLELDQDNIEFKSIIPEPEDVIVFECVLKN